MQKSRLCKLSRIGLQGGLAIFLFASVVTLGFVAAYKRGMRAEHFARIPFDLEVYLALYEVSVLASESTPNSELAIAWKENAQLLLHSKVQQYDQVHGTGSAINDGRLEERMERAREIASRADLVSLREMFPESEDMIW